MNYCMLCYKPLRRKRRGTKYCSDKCRYEDRKGKKFYTPKPIVEKLSYFDRIAKWNKKLKELQ